MKLDYTVDRSIDCVQINTDNWLSGSLVGRYKMSGRTVTTNLTTVVNKHITEKYKEVDEALTESSVILLSRVVSDISRDRAYEIEGKKFYDIPVMQILGYFTEGKIDFEHFNLLYDKIMIKKADLRKQGLLYSVYDSSTVGEVIKTGTCKFDTKGNKQPLTVHSGDIIVVQDNIATEIELDGEKYLIVTEDAVVGIFESLDNVSVETMKVVNNCILMENYQSESLFNSDALLTPNLNYEELDYSDIYNKDIFKVLAVDENLQTIKKNDIIFTDSDLTFYVFLNGKKYFLLKGTQYISGKLI